MIAYGYDCNYEIMGNFEFDYKKTGTKSRPRAAMVNTNKKGISLRLYLNNVDKHREHIENAPPHIKKAFVFTGGDCTSCNTACAPGKNYIIDGEQYRKCNHRTFMFDNPTVEKLPDYTELLARFFTMKK